MPLSASTEANRYAAASRSISSTGIGICTVTPLTPFEETVLHVFVDKSDREFFTRTKSNRNVPQIQIDPAILPEAFSANIPLARPGQCQAPLGNLPEERVCSVLNAAAQFRLQKKPARIRAKIENHGRDEALFQEIAGALSYKENKLPFMLIAQRLSLRSLLGKMADAEAILFGLAGFLESPDLAVYKKSAKNYVRANYGTVGGRSATVCVG